MQNVFVSIILTMTMTISSVFRLMGKRSDNNKIPFEDPLEHLLCVPSFPVTTAQEAENPNSSPIVYKSIGLSDTFCGLPFAGMDGRHLSWRFSSEVRL